MADEVHEAFAAPTSKPVSIGHAVTLLYATLGIGVVRTALETPRLLQFVSIGFVMFTTSVVLGLTWFLIYMVGRGRNWARITLLLGFLAGIPLAVQPLLQSLAAEPVSGVLGLVQVAI